MKVVEATAFDREVSPTAANINNRLFGSSGEMKYLVMLAMSGGAQKPVIVTAVTGDDAAAQAIASNPGWKCAYVGPAGDAAPNVAEAAIIN